jgi:hypothetical protein
MNGAITKIIPIAINNHMPYAETENSNIISESTWIEVSAISAIYKDIRAIYKIFFL